VVVGRDNRFRVLGAAADHRKRDDAENQMRPQISLPAALKVHAVATAGRVNDIQRTGIAFARKLSESAI
jgi:hypothetical protein